MRYVIIGNGPAGISAAEAIRRTDSRAEVVILSDEMFPGYSRVLLPNLIAGKIDERSLIIRDYEWYRDNHLTLRVGRRVVAIDPDASTVTCQDTGSGKMEKLGYDRLLIATGATPGGTVYPGGGIHTLRNLADAKAILSAVRPGARIAVLGGGLVGLKAAEAFRLRGLDVSLIVSSGQILSRVLDPASARLLEGHLQSCGISLSLGVGDVSIERKPAADGALFTVGSKAGEDVFDLVVMAKGVRPELEMLLQAGLACNRGLLTDARCMTNKAAVFAAGDVAQSPGELEEGNSLYTLWPDAVAQGRVAGANMAGGAALHTGGISMNSFEIFGLRCISAGRSGTGPAVEFTGTAEDGTTFRRAFFHHEGRLIGYAVLGSVEGAGVYLSALRARARLPEIEALARRPGYGYSLARMIESAPARDETA